MSSQVRIIITPDGKIAAFVDNGSYPEAVQVLEQVLGDLAALEIEFEEGEPTVEQHRHDDPEDHVHDHGHTHQHPHDH